MDIIIADDSMLARKFIRRCLEISGLSEGNYIEVEDGKRAMLEMKNITPNLIVSDLNMPNVNGIDLVKRILASPRLNSVPIIVITSAGNKEQREELIELGVKEILTKPINPSVLSKSLEKLKII